MKVIFIIILTFIIIVLIFIIWLVLPKKIDLKSLVSTNYTPPKFEVLYPEEIVTLYKMDNRNFDLIKVFKINEKEVEVNHINLNRKKGFEPFEQKLIKSEIITVKKAHELLENSKDKYNWAPFSRNNVFFIQVQPSKEMLKLGLDIDLRNSIESLIDEEFQKIGDGHFFAADLGPGGLNMLCVYKDERNCMKAILKVLCENGLEKHTLITKRIMMAKDDWVYEIVYPYKYSGQFYSM